jgi:hypothetical protein
LLELIEPIAECVTLRLEVFKMAPDIGVLRSFTCTLPGARQKLAEVPLTGCVSQDMPLSR